MFLHGQKHDNLFVLINNTDILKTVCFFNLIQQMAPKFKCAKRRLFTKVVIPSLTFTCKIWLFRALERYCSLTGPNISKNSEDMNISIFQPTHKFPQHILFSNQKR